MSEINDGEMEFPEPTLRHIIESKELKWIFVGGKGGVGKTTTSCSLAIQLTKTHKNVLVISTDPAHNLSDAFKQKFSNQPIKVNGFTNLSCMEIETNPERDLSKFMNLVDDSANPESKSQITSLVNEIISSIPGIDEALSFSLLTQQVDKMDYDVVVFDTAPTGHTLRLIGLPTLLEKSIDSLSNLGGSLFDMFNQVSALMGPNAPNMGDIKKKLNDMKANIQRVTDRFQNHKETTFVCVCIPEYLPVYETNRLIQQLNKYKMSTNSIVVNQILFPYQGTTCDKCLARRKIQDKYINQILDLFDNFHIVMIPELTEEVRGKESLEKFSENLYTEYNPEEHGEMIALDEE